MDHVVDPCEEPDVPAALLCRTGTWREPGDDREALGDLVRRASGVLELGHDCRDGDGAASVGEYPDGLGCEDRAEAEATFSRFVERIRAWAAATVDAWSRGA